MKALGIIAAILAIMGLIFLCIDCVSGQSHWFKARILDKEYHTAYTTISTSIDSKGNSYVSTIYHQEEYHIICGEVDGNHIFDCESDRAAYYTHTNSQTVFVVTREGRFSGVQYMPQVRDEKPPVEQ